MIKKILYGLSFFFLPLLTGCAEEDWLWNGSEEDRDYVELSFAMPEPTIVDTRAFGSANFESELGNATVYILKENGTSTQSERSVLQTEDISASSSTSIKIRYNDQVKEELKNGTVRIIAVANSDASLANVGNEEDIYNLSTTKEVTDSEMPGMIMTGILSGQTKAQLNKPVTIELVRAAAKATVNVKEGVPFEISEYQMYNSASKGWFAAGIDGNKEDIASPVSSFVARSNKATEAGNPVYGYCQKPLEKPEDNLGADGRAFLVVGGVFNNETTYYRVDFRSKEENGKYKYYFLEPNHEYQFTIIKVKSKGYSTPEEAAKHPLQDIEVEIHDHVPAIMSMISDGARELGVNREVRHTNTESDGGEYMTMKLYSYISENEYPSIDLNHDYDTKTLSIGNDFKIEVTSGDWLKIGRITSASDEYEEGEQNSSTNGKLYHVGLKYDSSIKLTGELEGALRVTWKGLTRDVKVIWKRTFRPTDICDATFQIIYNGSKTSKVGSRMYSPVDYWDFIGASDVDNLTDVKGLSQADNCDNIRNEGFHLPLYYGGEEDARNWTYKYVITLKDAIYTSGAQVTATASDYRDLNISVSGKTITIECPADRYGWDYNGEGKLLIKVGTAEYPFSLYHTGFFHKEGQYDLHGDTGGAAKYNAPSSDYYYYEVRTIGEYHWLDRNIGAESNAMAVRDSNGTIVVGNPNAAGGYFRAAKYQTYANPGDKDHLFDLCPPGFRIPFTSEWDALRNSDRYHDSQAIEDGEVYYQSYALDNNDLPVYLPKLQYYANSFVGDSRAGYYWTRNQASGVEKEEIGKWMRALMFSGASNSYINGNAQEYGMQVRAVAGELKDNGPSMNTIGFKVKGATHVYVYDAGEIYPVSLSPTDNRDPSDGGHHDEQKYGLMSWPGQAIGDASTMVNGADNSGLTYNFTYTTSTPKSDLRFIFTYVKDGKITVFCRKIEKDKDGVNRYNGYPLTDHYYFNNVDNKVIEVGGKQNVEDNTKKYRVYIWEKSDNSKPRGARLYAGNTLIIDADWAAFKKDGEYYYYDFQSSAESFKLKWSLKYDCGHNGSHTADYSNQQETSNGSMGYNNSIERYCMTIKNWNESSMTDPNGNGGGSDPEEKNYRIYFPSTSTKMHMWWTDSNGKDQPFINGINSMNEADGKEGNYCYINFSAKGIENEKIKFARLNNNVTDRNFTLSQFKYESDADGRYCAYIDTNDNFNAGKPTDSPTPPDDKEKKYRIYYQRWYEDDSKEKKEVTNFSLWIDGGSTLVAGKNGDNCCNDHKYKEFTHTGDEDKTLKFWGGYDSNCLYEGTLNYKLKDFIYDSTLDAYVLNIWDKTGYPEKPSSVRRKPASSKSSKRSR